VLLPGPEQRAPMPHVHGGRQAADVRQRRPLRASEIERRASGVKAPAATGGRLSAWLPVATMDGGDRRKQVVAGETIRQGKKRFVLYDKGG
jgi:hypothetical protein